MFTKDIFFNVKFAASSFLHNRREGIN